jgi:hypothetical protein
MPASVNWVIISSLATALGTLVLAVATFASVRSANNAARVAQRSFQVALRPILAQSRAEDPEQRIMYGDRHWVIVRGGEAVVEVAEGVVYLAMQVRNVGNGIAMIEGWQPFDRMRIAVDDWPDTTDFRPQTRSLWIPPGDVAFWQGALRDQTTELQRSITRAVSGGEVGIDLLYRDHEGMQPTISRFTLIRDDGGDHWWVSLGSHRPVTETSQSG